jgi:hypothetical protein
MTGREGNIVIELSVQACSVDGDCRREETGRIPAAWQRGQARAAAQREELGGVHEACGRVAKVISRRTRELS